MGLNNVEPTLAIGTTDIYNAGVPPSKGIVIFEGVEGMGFKNVGCIVYLERRKKYWYSNYSKLVVVLPSCNWFRISILRSCFKMLGIIHFCYGPWTDIFIILQNITCISYKSLDAQDFNFKLLLFSA